ncbi:hypothetical protein SNE40_021895 [Patella caerulea]|uniref:2-oxoisovalerate dehydrogenase subunit alpha n=1 Tax=Patella caerulea TaxID=87958 RepID=A0AAN8GD05_PATCE
MQMTYKRLKSTNIPNISQYMKKGISGESLENTNPRNSKTKEKYEFLGTDMEYCDELDFIVPEEKGLIPVYRVLNIGGKLVTKNQDPQLSPDVYLKMYKDMVLMNSVDTVLTEAQTNGVVSFYLTNHGEEATQIGSAAASVEMVNRILEASQEHKLPSPEAMFTDVYDVVPKHLEKQFNDLKRHLQSYPDEYPLEKHDR